MSIESPPDPGSRMYELAARIFPFSRSLTGNGVRQTFNEIKKLLPEIQIYEIPTGTPAFDWTVPDEWNIRDAYVEDESGNRVIDFKDNNLHVVGYSHPIDAWMSLEELNKNLYSLPEQEEAIPYITSYYKRHWGFCIRHADRLALREGRYHVVIDSTLGTGSLTYGDLILPGETEKEVLLSTYICHPSMANNEVSGIVLTTALAQWLKSLERRRLTYRIVFIPETIGSIVYVSRNIDILKRNTIAGFVVTCVGDNRTYSFMPSRLGNTLADRVARHVLKYHAPDYISYTFLERGSDERQYCSIGVDLPVVSLMRSKYGTYPEYHTSLDDLSLISPAGLKGSYEALQKCLMLLEENQIYRTTCLCEPQMGKRGLYPTISKSQGGGAYVRTMMNIIAYADGENDLIALAEKIGVSADGCVPMLKILEEKGLVTKVNASD